MFLWQFIIRCFHKGNYHIHYFLACAVAFESRKCMVDSFVSFLFFLRALCCRAPRRKEEFTKGTGVAHCFYRCHRSKERKRRAAWVQTRVSWIERRTFTQGAHNRYRGHNNKACACKTRRSRAAPRASFERRDCLLPIIKEKTTSRRRNNFTLSFCHRTHKWELSHGLFVTQRSVANVRVDTIYSWLCQQADND